MYLESKGFDPNAISPTGAAGLGQFTKSTWIQTVDHSSHPELQKIARLPYNQLLLKRHDPHLNALATGEYIGVAYQKLKRAFTANNIKDENGKVAEPAMAELYSYHNTGNAGVALAARQGLTVKDAPIMNMQQKKAAVDSNKGLYPQGIDTPARDYMRLVEEKLQQGLKYQDFSPDNENSSNRMQVSSSSPISPKISLVDQAGLPVTDPTVLAETSQLYADNALAGRLGGLSDGTTVVSGKKLSDTDGKNPPATAGKQNTPTTVAKQSAYQIYDVQADKPDFVSGNHPMKGRSVQDLAIVDWSWGEPTQVGTPNQTPEGVQDAFNFGKNKPYVADPAAFRMQEKINDLGDQIIKSAQDPKGRLHSYYLSALKNKAPVEITATMLGENNKWRFGGDVASDSQRVSWPFGHVAGFIEKMTLAVDKNGKIKVNGVMSIPSDNYSWKADSPKGGYSGAFSNKILKIIGNNENGPNRNDINSAFPPLKGIPFISSEKRVLPKEWKKKSDRISTPELNIMYNRKMSFNVKSK